MAQDGARCKIRNELYRLNGKLAARVTSTGGWLDLVAMRSLAKFEDFDELPSSLKQCKLSWPA